MASDRSFVEYVCDQLRGAGDVAARPMFGEYGVYYDAKMVALVCDNQLFVKPTPAGRAFLPALSEAPPYPGAKPYLLVGDELEQPELMAELIRLTAAALPPPKPKPPKPPKSPRSPR